MSVFFPIFSALRAFLPWYLAVINPVAFLFYGADKRKAVKDRWRTPESVLIGLAALGGGPGALLGMRAFHHKTHKLKFQILIPLFCILWAGILSWLYLF